MGFFADIANKLFPPADLDEDDLFPKIDVGRDIRDLNVEKLGAENGKAGTPPPDQTVMDSVEQRIASHYTDRWNGASGKYLELMAVYKRRLDYAIDEAGQVQDASGKVAGDFQKISQIAEMHLANQRDLVEQLEAEYRHFRTENRLHRTAAPRGSRALTIGLLLAALVGESVLNGAFLADVFGGAILVAFVFAVGISTINVTASLLLGIFARYVNHVHFIKRMMGLLVIALFGAWFTGFNLFVAKFRDAAEALEWEAALVASVSRFVEAPFELENFQSWMLALLGALISIIVFIKGVNWDDYFPAFGRLFRRRNAARQGFADEATNALEEIREVREASRTDLNAAREHLIHGLNETTLILSEGSALRSRFRAYHDQMQNAANLALRTYRDANVRARPEGTASPAHFNEVFSLPPIPPLSDDSDIQADSAQLRKSFDKMLTAARTAIEEEYKAAQASIPRIGDLSASDGSKE